MKEENERKLKALQRGGNTRERFIIAALSRLLGESEFSALVDEGFSRRGLRGKMIEGKPSLHWLGKTDAQLMDELGDKGKVAAVKQELASTGKGKPAGKGKAEPAKDAE